MQNYKVYSKKFILTTIVVCLLVMILLGGGIGAAVYFGLKANADTLHSEVLIKSTSAAPLSASTNGEYSIVDVVDLVANTVVEINVTTTTTSSFGGTSTSSSAGSGVFITSTGYIVTNNHVVSGADTITVSLRDGTVYKATLVGTDAKTDIAVIKVTSAPEGTTFKHATFGDSSTLKVGQTVIAIGNPLGSLGGSVTDGIISALDRELTVDSQVMTLLQTNAAINPGNSGGGLFDLNGSLIGIVNAKSTGYDVEGLGFAIPSNIAFEVAKELIENGYVTGRLDLGFSYTVGRAQIGTQVYSGLFVTGITNTHASQLRTNDYISAIDDQTITTVAALDAYLNTKAVGDTIKITVVRASGYSTNTIQIELTLTQATK